MISEKQKNLVDNMSLSELKQWIHSTFGISNACENNELKNYMIKKYYEKYDELQRK